MTNFESQLQSDLIELCQFERVPHSKGYYHAQEYISDRLQSLGLSVQRHDFYDLPMGKCRNLYAETGPQSSSRLLIGAHYESKKSSGVAADDNASAVAVSLALAEKLPRELPATFVFFDVEENFGFGGLHGSRAFSKFYSKPISLALIFDLIGGSFMPSFDNLMFQFGNGLPSLEIESLEVIHLPMKILEPIGSIGARSDYNSFRKQGIPFSFFSTGTPWYYHTNYDTPEIIRFDKMEKFVRGLLPYLSTSQSPNTADWSNFNKFIRRVRMQTELDDPFFEKLQNSTTEPSRLEVIQLYRKLLPRLKKFGPKLWG